MKEQPYEPLVDPVAYAAHWRTPESRERLLTLFIARLSDDRYDEGKILKVLAALTRDDWRESVDMIVEAI